MTRLPSAYAVHAPAASAQARAAGCLDSCDLVRRNDLPHHQVRRHATAQLRDLLLSPEWPGLATGSVATLACYLSLRLPLRPDSGYPIEPITAVMLVIGWLIGNSVHQARAHAEQLRAQAATQAVTGERLRIARELHDMVAHSTGIVALQAGAARRIIDTQPSLAREALGEIEAASREALAGLRRTLGALRESDPADAAGSMPTEAMPGLADIDRLAAATAAAGVRVEVRWLGQRRPLPQEISLSAYRIIQEAVTNVVRHADTRACQVTVDCRADELSIEVVDAGRGHGTTTGTGYGLPDDRARRPG
jgi:signal transduction histidine kinase